MRICLVASLAVVLLVVGALLPLVMPWRCPVNRAASEQIEEGMSQAEVYAILGGPPGDYRTRPPRPFVGPVSVDRRLCGRGMKGLSSFAMMQTLRAR